MIQIKDLTFRYSGAKTDVFSHFNLEFQPGCIYGLLGKNGTGKSTLLNLLCGVLNTSEGEVLIDGVKSMTKTKSVLEKLYLVPEEFMFPQCTLRQYIQMFRPFYKDFSQEIMDSCLREFELEDAFNLKLHKLSMGTKKKVVMSFALATNTKILIMDEPTNGLDIPSKRQFRKVIANNMTDDRIIIISTHQVHDVEMLIDHVTLIGQKGLLLNASTCEIAERYTFGKDPQGKVLFSEKTIDGTICMAERNADEEETPVNLEMLFEYFSNKN